MKYNKKDKTLEINGTTPKMQIGEERIKIPKIREKRYTKITKERLDECLKAIGWSTWHAGCNMHFITNACGEHTNYRFRSENKKDLISEITYEGEFGYGGNGNCVFILKGCYLLLSKDCLSVMVNKAKDCDQPAFLSFYNFNK